MLKALLLTLDVDYRWTHDITELSDRLEDAGHPLPDELLPLQELTLFAVRFRYADDASLEPFDRRRSRELLGVLRGHVERVMAERT